MIDITSTPIQTLVESIGYDSMQTYVWVMIILVAVMTVADMIHKKSATYFFQNSEKAQADVKKGLADGNSNCTIGTNEGRFKELTAGDKMGIAVRTGHHCAQPIMDFFQIPGTIRASFSFYNTFEEVDRLVAGVKKAQMMLE